MAIMKDGCVLYSGAVLGESEHMWMDGMLQTYADVWDMTEHRVRTITTGYYGSDGHNLHENVDVVVEVDPEVARDIIRTRKEEALKDFCRSVQAYKAGIRKGTKAVVVRGRKVPKGSRLTVFWVGERPTWESRQYSWINEAEEIAGAYDETGRKVWVKTEYLKSLDPIKSPCAAERKKYIAAYVERNTTPAVRKAARTGNTVITL